MKKILSLMKFDTTNSIRDSLIIYLLIAPILLAGGVKIFLPSLETAVISLAVEVPQDGPGRAQAQGFAEELSQFARIEEFAHARDVKKRVLGTDDVGGLIRQDDGDWQIILEGNEDGNSRVILQSVIDVVSRGGFEGEYQVSQASKPSLLGPYAAVMLVMMAVLIGGLAVAFGMIDEKEQGVSRAFAVTPLRPWQYFTARGGLALIIGAGVALAGHLIMAGFEVPLGLFLVALVSSAAMPLAIAMIVGGLAKNQIQAVAVLKVVMLLYLTVPMITIFISADWHPLFYIFPNYWMFRTFEDLYLGFRGNGSFWISAGINTLMGLGSMGIIALTIGKKLRPR
ncbi:ABC transporter permease [Spirochaeta lutea]|uniref:ABC-2 type transporter transmembrane domain-containing protein n=1 Tax=Spirochaeta lutea TaxID=1480694 RepID=A0A098R3Q9_9SPIO|nr:ABC transporter permease [Spirochaeta lutea]KGE73327.1 hypothetical protein DC28_04140 [Spirochaeta lutea]